MTVGESQLMAALLIGGEKITQLINRCRIYELLYLRYEPTKTPFTANLIAALVALYIVVLRFLADAKKLYDQSFLARTLGRAGNGLRTNY